jgi:hypothetical protein
VGVLLQVRTGTVVEAVGHGTKVGERVGFIVLIRNLEETLGLDTLNIGLTEQPKP